VRLGASIVALTIRSEFESPRAAARLTSGELSATPVLAAASVWRSGCAASIAIVAVTAGYAGLEHPALDERAVFVIFSCN